MEWMVMPYKRYADFSGRSQRTEYWMFMLLYLIVIVALLALSAALDGLGGGTMSSIFIAPLVIFIIASIVPMIAVTVRRLHDQDKSGWFYLINFIPYVGGFIMLVFMCIDGTPGSNQYGPDPKGGDADIFS